MAQQTILLSRLAKITVGRDGGVTWFRIAELPIVTIDSSLLESNAAFTMFSALEFNTNGTIALSSASWSNEFSQNGGFDITLGGVTYSFNISRVVITTQYLWTPLNIDDVRKVIATAREGTTSADKIVLRDFPAPRYASITAVPEGEGGGTQTLSATLNGTYDSVTYEWSVSNGTLDNASSASPVWTRPSVEGLNIDTRISVEVTFTYSGGETVFTTSVVSITNNPLPVASKGTATAVLNTIANGESGDTRNLDVTVTKGTGVYDNVSYRWAVGQGALSDNAIKNPVWTLPTVFFTTSVSVTLVVTFSGDNTTAARGSSFTITSTTTVTISPSAGQFTGDLSTGNFIRWSATTKSLSFGVYPEIIGSFVPSGTRRFLTNLSVTSTRLDIGFGPTSTSTARADLSPLFERAGAIKLTVGSTEYIIPMDSQDSSDNYRLTRPRSVISAFASAWDGTGTLEFIYPINMYHDGSVYHEVFLGSTRYKKIYLGSEEYI